MLPDGRPPREREKKRSGKKVSGVQRSFSQFHPSRSKSAKILLEYFRGPPQRKEEVLSKTSGNSKRKGGRFPQREVPFPKKGDPFPFFTGRGVWKILRKLIWEAVIRAGRGRKTLRPLGQMIGSLIERRVYRILSGGTKVAMKRDFCLAGGDSGIREGNGKLRRKGRQSENPSPTQKNAPPFQRKSRHGGKRKESKKKKKAAKSQSIRKRGSSQAVGRGCDPQRVFREALSINKSQERGKGEGGGSTPSQNPEGERKLGRADGRRRKDASFFECMRGRTISSAAPEGGHVQRRRKPLKRDERCKKEPPLKSAPSNRSSGRPLMHPAGDPRWVRPPQHSYSQRA